jgi:lysophospholipase L1-like esterase
MPRIVIPATGSFLGVLLLAVAPLRADLLIQPQDVVAVCDDSFAGPRQSSVDVADYLLMCQPVPGVRVLQLGMNRETVEMFMNRAESDLSPFQPTVMITSLGTNDAQVEDLTHALTYHTKYRAQTVDELKKIGVRTVVLASTGCFDSSMPPVGTGNAAAWNKNLGTLRDADQQVATTSGAIFSDPFQVMLDAMPKAKAMYGDNYSFNISDGIHQAGSGQLIKAYAFLKALGCDGGIGTISVDLTTNTAEGTPGQKIVSVKGGTVDIESTRYPFCFTGSPEKSNATSGAVQFFPFNDDLNRYLLVVKGLRGSQAKVTWGTKSLNFPAADLAKGINLAAAFATHTPFDAQFAKVEAAVWAQQEPQLTYLLYFFHNLADYRVMVAGQTAAAVDQLAKAILAQDTSRAAAASALVVPVRHTLKIEDLP